MLNKLPYIPHSSYLHLNHIKEAVCDRVSYWMRGKITIVKKTLSLGPSVQLTQRPENTYAS